MMGVCAAAAAGAWACAPALGGGDAAGGAEGKPFVRPGYRLFRWDEDYRFLDDPALRTDFFDPAKHVRLAEGEPGVYVSFGGEARTRYESYSSRNFGITSAQHDDYFLQRLLAHADLHAGLAERLEARGFVEVVSGLVWGEELPKPATQENDADLQQAFGDVLAHWDGGSLRLRGGRQEMGYGSYRLVTARDPTNTRLAFDGVRATLETGGATVDAFLTRPVEALSGAFDDSSDRSQAFWGVYAALPLEEAGGLGVDAYYLGLSREDARFESGVGDELRHSVGARLWGKGGGWDHDTEAVVQFGSFDPAGDPGRSILAWTIASNTGYTFADVAWRPRVGLKLNYASGDGDAADGRLGTFNPLFPKNNYFSEAALLAPLNFFDAHPSVQVRPAEDVTLTLAWDVFFRASEEDAVYAPGGIVVPAGASGGRFVGSTLWVQAEWSVGPHATVSASYVHFFSGEVVSDAGGDDVDFVGAWVTLRF